MSKPRMQHISTMQRTGIPYEFALIIHGQAESTGKHRFWIHNLKRTAKHF